MADDSQDWVVIWVFRLILECVDLLLRQASSVQNAPR